MNNSPGAEVQRLDDPATGEVVEAVEDFLLLELEFLTEHGIVDLNEEDAAADDALGGAAVRGVLADQGGPIFGDEVFDFILADFIFLLDYFDEVAEGKGGAQPGDAVVLGQAAQRGDQVVGGAGVVHGRRRRMKDEG